LPADTLESLRRRAEEALANEEMDRTRLGYDVLVKLKMDELIERGFMPSDVRASQGNLEMVAVEPGTFQVIDEDQQQEDRA
jgi:hypothetical protein